MLSNYYSWLFPDRLKSDENSSHLWGITYWKIAFPVWTHVQDELDRYRDDLELEHFVAILMKGIGV